MTSYLSRFKSAVVKRLDSWATTLVDVGSSLGRSSLEGPLEIVDWGTAEYLYNFNGLAARLVDAVPKHALRQGFKVTSGDKRLDERLRVEINHLGLVHRTRQAWTWARLYGGAALYLGIDDGLLPSEPVQPALVKRLVWVREVSSRDLWPVEWNSDPRSPHFGTPTRYLLTRQGGSATTSLVVHATRLVRFEGVTPTQLRRQQLNGWGDSVLQRCITELRQLRDAFGAAAILVRQASQGVVSVKGLAEVTAGDAEETFRRRLGLMAEAMSVANILLLDTDGEKFDRIEVGQLAGLVEVLDRFANMLSAVSAIPVTVLMGTAPAGLNATGDSDIRNWYDELGSERVAYLEPRLLWVLRLMCSASEGPTAGVVPPELKIEFPSLWQPTENEAADLREKQADTDTKYVAMNAIRPDEVRASRFGGAWSSETTLSDPPAGTPVVSADSAGAQQHAASFDLLAKVADRVASRQIPRAAGVAQVQHALGVDPARAEALLGPEHYTVPELSHAAELDRLRGEHAAALRSQQSAKTMLRGVLERNRNGELVKGNPILRAAAGLEPDETDEPPASPGKPND